MIRMTWGKTNPSELHFVSATWKGTENQAARSLEFTVPSNPYDPDFKNPNIKLGDIVRLYDDNTLLFLGVVTSRERQGARGEASYSAYDYMHYLLRSNVTKVFKKTTPKKIARKLCKQVKVPIGKLANPKLKIKSAIYEDKPIYDIIIAVYRKAYMKNGKRYMPVMNGKKLDIVIKGTDSGVTLDQQNDILNARYHDTTDNMVNIINIYGEGHKKVGQVKNATQVSKYGKYMQVYTKEEDVNAKSAAKQLLVGITKEASVEAIGDVRAVAGKALAIHDSATKLSGIFYISSDSHTFQNGVHTMQLDIVWKNEMEEGAEETEND